MPFFLVGSSSKGRTIVEESILFAKLPEVRKVRMIFSQKAEFPQSLNQ